MADQQFCLRWNNHQSTLISVFDSLLERGAMVDCTLAAEGQCLQAHKVVLSACSPYLETLLSQHYDKHPILLLKDVKFYELQAMMDYMYRGEVNVAQDKLGMFLKAAESLQIKGLSDSGGNEPPDTGGGTSAKRTSKGAPVTNVPRSGGGLTVERRRPQQPQTSQVVDIPSDSGSRDGSESPSLRRKRRRRTSGGDDSAVEGDSSNTGDVSRTQSSAPISSDQVPMNGSADSNALGILSSLMDGSVETENSVQEPGPSLGTSQTQPSQRIREKMEPTSGQMIQPKAEYLDTEENIEDLTLDDDNDMDSGMDAGPSQRQGAGYQWHMGDQGADEVFMAAQEAVGANRDAQGLADFSGFRDYQGFQGPHDLQGLQGLPHGFPGTSGPAGLQGFPSMLNMHTYMREESSMLQEDFYDYSEGAWPAPHDVQDFSKRELGDEPNEGLDGPEDTEGRFRDIFNYLSFKKYPPNVGRNIRSNFRKCTRSFIVHDGLLYHKTKLSVVRGSGYAPGVPRYVVVVAARDQRERVMRLAHEGVDGSAHRGINATTQLLDRRYWWPNMSGDVKNFCRSCMHCNVQKAR